MGHVDVDWRHVGAPKVNVTSHEDEFSEVLGRVHGRLLA